MARARFIRPEFFTDERMGELPMGARLLFAAIWTNADMRGVFDASEKQLRVQAFPYDEDVSSRTVLEWFRCLLESGRVQVWDADGKRWGAVVNWMRHQTISHREVEIGTDRPMPPGWVDPPEWQDIVAKGIKAGRVRKSVAERSQNGSRTVLERFQNCPQNNTLTPTLTTTPATAAASTREAAAAAPGQGMFDGIKPNPVQPSPMIRSWQDWKFGKRIGMNRDGSREIDWISAYERLGWDELTKGYEYFLKRLTDRKHVVWANQIIERITDG